MPKNNGFTLIELLVTITIVAVLASSAFVSYNVKEIREKTVNYGLTSILARVYNDIESGTYSNGKAPSVEECTKLNQCNKLFSGWPMHPDDKYEIIYGKVGSTEKDFCFAGLAEPFKSGKYMVVGNIEDFPQLDICNLVGGESGFESTCQVENCEVYPYLD